MSNLWSDRDVDLLEKWATQYPTEIIAKRLKRSKQAILWKAHKLNLSLKPEIDYITVNELCNLIGVYRDAVRDWINAGHLKAYKTSEHGIYRIRMADFRTFYSCYCHQYPALDKIDINVLMYIFDVKKDKPWNAEEDMCLNMWAEGFPMEVIAARLQRSHDDVKKRAKSLNITVTPIAEYLSVRDLAKQLSCHCSSLMYHISKGNIKGYRINQARVSGWYIKKADLREFYLQRPTICLFKNVSKYTIDNLIY